MYFDSLRRTVERASAATDQTHQKDEIVLSLFLAVTAVEVFVNIYFRIVVTVQNFQQHEQLVIDDLDVSQPSGPKGIDYKLRHWPPKILGKSIAWQTGVAKEFDETRAAVFKAASLARVSSLSALRRKAKVVGALDGHLLFHFSDQANNVGIVPLRFLWISPWHTPMPSSD